MKCEHLHCDLSNAYNVAWKYKMCKAEQSVQSYICRYRLTGKIKLLLHKVVILIYFFFLTICCVLVANPIQAEHHTHLLRQF